MDEEDELVSGDDAEHGVYDDDMPPAPPEERDDAAAIGDEAEDERDEAEAEEFEEMTGVVSQAPGEDEEDEEDPELDSDCSVPYNRQFYAVPNGGAIARDYNHPLEVPSIDRLSEMSQPTPPPEKWPAVDQIEPSMIVVLKGKVAAGDSTERYVWYIRVVVAGDEGAEGDDKNIFRHIPKSVVKKLVAFYNADASLRTSSLLTKYVPYDDNNKPLNPSKLHDNNWSVRKPPPKTLAQVIGKENKPGGAPAAAGSSKRPVEDAPLAEPVAKKVRQGTVAPPLAKGKAPAAAPAAAPAPASAPSKSLKDLGKGPTKSSTPTTFVPAMPKPKAVPAPGAAAPTPSAPKPKPVSAPVAPKPKAPVPAASTDASKAPSVRGSPSETTPQKPVPMGSVDGPAPGHKMTKTLVVQSDEHKPSEAEYTISLPAWCNSWKITAEFTGKA